MQVLKRRNNKRIALSLFQSSWHIFSIQNENASGCCVVFLPWTCIPESSKIMSYCFLNIYFFSSALRKEVSTLLCSGISGDSCVMGTWLEQESAQRVLCAASPGAAMGSGWADPFTASCLAPLRPTAGSKNAAGVDWVDWRGAGFGSEPWCCQWSGPESGLTGTPTPHSFAEATLVWRNHIGHWVQPTHFVGEGVEQSVSDSLWVSCLVSGKATMRIRSPDSSLVRCDSAWSF